MNETKEKIVIFTSVIGEKDIYQIRSALPDWTLTKYIISRYPELQKEVIDEKTMALFEEIAAGCFKGWRYGESGEWNPDPGKIPGAVMLDYITTMMTQAKVEVKTTVRAEGN